MSNAHIKVIGSGSSGNGYIIKCKDESLVLELGMDFRQYNDKDFGNISACLVSHEHKDHLRETTLGKFLLYGITVASNKSVKERFGGVFCMEAGHKYLFGSKFVVQPVPVTHSVENYAYVIDHDDFGRLVFVTDAQDFSLHIPRVNHWMIEANWSEEKVIDREIKGNKAQDGTFQHLPYETCVDVLTKNLCPETSTVTLIHLSDENSNALDFVKGVKDATGIPFVEAAEPGMEIPLQMNHF